VAVDEEMFMIFPLAVLSSAGTPLGAQERPFDVDSRNAIPFLGGDLVKRLPLDVE